MCECRFICWSRLTERERELGWANLILYDLVLLHDSTISALDIKLQYITIQYDTVQDSRQPLSTNR